MSMTNTTSTTVAHPQRRSTAKPAAKRSRKAPALFATGAEMAILWERYIAARDGFREEGAEGTGRIFDRAERAIVNAHTVDLQGLAIKLKVCDAREGDQGMLLGMVKDIEAATKTPMQAASSAREPLLDLWRKTRAAWARFNAVDEAGAAYDKAERSYHRAHKAFRAQEPTTPLGHFLQLLDTDDGDDFADEHPEIVESIIKRLQSPLVQLSDLPQAAE